MGLSFGINAKTQEIEPCFHCDCIGCMFHSDEGCYSTKLKWADEEYIGPVPQVDWSKVPVDAKIWVKNKESDKWLPRYFAEYVVKDNTGMVRAWSDGATSWSARGMATTWNYMKLAEEDR